MKILLYHGILKFKAELFMASEAAAAKKSNWLKIIILWIASAVFSYQEQL
ncbi:MAG: hypothetical protein UMU04_01490 [Halanaerobiales bacterium]|nr:hypothetical protein [Halanaerobiales bacterium]